MWVQIFTDADPLSLCDRALAFMVSEAVADKVGYDRRGAPLHKRGPDGEELFAGIRRQIEAERGSASGEAIRQNAASLAKRIVRVVEEPEPIYTERLSPERMAELERRILRLLKAGEPASGQDKVLDLS